VLLDFVRTTLESMVTVTVREHVIARMCAELPPMEIDSLKETASCTCMVNV